jgi:hypothetical protein
VLSVAMKAMCLGVVAVDDHVRAAEDGRDRSRLDGRLNAAVGSRDGAFI